MFSRSPPFGSVASKGNSAGSSDAYGIPQHTPVKGIYNDPAGAARRELSTFSRIPR